MDNKRDSFILKYIASFILTIIIFVIIFLIAYTSSYLNYQRIYYENSLIKDNLIFLDRLFIEFEDEKNCSNKLLLESSEKLDFVGDLINTLEFRLGKNDKRVLEQKKLYSALELNHYKIIKKLNSVCNENFVTIFFFYSNDKPYDELSKRTSAILSVLKNENPYNLMIYSFDYNLDNDLISMINTNYNITNAPSVLIDEAYYMEVSDTPNLSDIFKYANEKILKSDSK